MSMPAPDWQSDDGRVRLYNADTLDVLRAMPDNAVGLIATDPPYYKVKGEAWDRQWDKPDQFLAWLGENCEQWQRVLRPNGSLYCFASPQMAARVEVEVGRWFGVLSSVVWNKLAGYAPGDRRATAYAARDHGQFRRFFDYSERCIFAEPLGGAGSILRHAISESGVKASDIANLFPSRNGNKTGCVSNWLLGKNTPTPDQWAAMARVVNLPPYSEAVRPFNVTADVPYTDVWTFPTVQAYKGKHPCEKPLAMMEHIVRASSREDFTVFDGFMGSGTTGEAAVNLGRPFIGVEKDPAYFEKAVERIKRAVGEPVGIFSEATP